MLPPGPMRRRIHMLAAAGMLAGLISACAQRQPTPKTTDGPTPSPAVQAIVNAAKAEERRPNRQSIAAPVPPGVDPALARVTDPNDANAMLPLEDVLLQLAGEPGRVDGPAASADDRAAALRRYVEGREKLLNGDARGALEDLKIATESDPASPEPWRELGEAQRALGLRSDAVRSFRAAVAAGLNEPRTLEVLGRDALERGDFEEAARLLSRAMLSNLDRYDPALRRIIPVQLSRALVPRGYHLAATQALRRALTDSTPLTSSTRYGAELGAIFRRQGDLWRDVGDGLCRLGRYGEALDAYIQADTLPSLDGSSVRPRIVFTLMKQGRPAAAAAAVLEDIAGRQGRAAESDLELLRHIADHGGNAPQIAGALGSLRNGSQSSPTINRDLSIAQCSLLSGDAARRALRAHLDRFPTDITGATRLFDSLDSPAAAVKEAAAIAADSPITTRVHAEALLRSRHDAAALFQSLKDQGPRSFLLLAYFCAKQGRPTEGLGLAQSASGPAALTAQVEMALDAGRPELAEPPLAALAESPGPVATRLRARSLLLAQRFSEALSALEPLLSSPDSDISRRIDDLILAGDLASRTDRAAKAEEWLNLALTLDPFDDRAYSILIVLHSAEGGVPDAQKLARVVREMRENCPDSRTIRMIRAREAMRRSQWQAAESDLRTLVQEDPADAGPVELLAAIWQERLRSDPAAAQNAIGWLERLLARRPQSPLLLAARTSIAIATDRAAEAEAPLRAAMQSGAGPDASRVLERLLRDILNRSAEADVLARARLSGRPRTIAESVELAEVFLRAKDFHAAISTLKSDLTGPIAPAHAARIVAIISQALPSEDPATCCDAANLLERCIPALDKLPVQTHQRRLEAMTVCPTIATDALIAAAALATDQYPQLQTGAYRVVIQGLFQARRFEIVPEFFSAAPNAAKSDVPLISTWIESVIRLGSARDGEALINALHSAGSIGILLNLDNPDLKEPRAEAAYMLGVGFASINKTADSEAMYEIALKFDPDHAWSCNNLGYSFADRGVNLDRASDLLERAYKAKPGETPIIDSLGWLRYKQGIILDVVNPQTGETTRRGALSLLQEAAATAQGRSDNTIQDHLGDALWLAGKAEEAVAAWERAAQLSEDAVTILRNAGRPRAADDDGDAREAPLPESAELAECRALIESTTAKREAAAAGRPVRVAPQIAEPDPQPIKPR